MEYVNRSRDIQRHPDIEGIKRDRTPSIERKSIKNIAGKINTLESKMREISRKVFNTNESLTTSQLIIKNTIDKIKFVGNEGKALIDDTIDAVKKIWDECEETIVTEGDTKKGNRYNQLANMCQTLHTSLRELDRTQDEKHAISIYEAIDSFIATSDEQSPHHVIEKLQEQWKNLKASLDETERPFVDSPEQSATEDNIESYSPRGKRVADHEIIRGYTKDQRKDTASSLGSFVEEITNTLEQSTSNLDHDLGIENTPQIQDSTAINSIGSLAQALASVWKNEIIGEEKQQTLNNATHFIRTMPNKTDTETYMAFNNVLLDILPGKEYKKERTSIQVLFKRERTRDPQ